MMRLQNAKMIVWAQTKTVEIYVTVLLVKSIVLDNYQIAHTTVPALAAVQMVVKIATIPFVRARILLKITIL